MQTASYATLFGLYSYSSGTSLYTQTVIVPLAELALPENIVVYFIADDDGDVYRTDLGTDRQEHIYDLHSHGNEEFLDFEYFFDSPPRKLVIMSEDYSMKDSETLATIAALPDRCAPMARDGRRTDRRPWRGFGIVPLLGEKSDWEFESGYWPLGGLRGTNSRTQATVRLSLETPFVMWEVRHATQLPNDYVVFQLGKRQICIFDPVTKRVALLAYGRSPIAVLKADPSADDQALLEDAETTSPADEMLPIGE